MPAPHQHTSHPPHHTQPVPHAAHHTTVPHYTHPLLTSTLHSPASPHTTQPRPSTPRYTTLHSNGEKLTYPPSPGTHLGEHPNLTCDTTLSPVASTSTVGNHTLSHQLDL